MLSTTNDKKGIFIVLIGPDGAGKSTVASALEDFARIHYSSFHGFHWRPGLLPKLGKQKQFTIDNAGMPGAPPPPPGSYSYGRALSLVRYLYYLIDFIVGYWIRIYPARRRGTLIIGERWYYDVILNPSRYGFLLPKWLLKAGGYIVPSPNLVILLSGDPEAIHVRKPELSKQEISRQLARMSQLVAKLPNSAVIATDGAIESTISAVHNALQNYSASQTKRSHSTIQTDAPEWRAFPEKVKPRLLIDVNANAASAVHLYHPYSFAGKAARLFLSYTPTRILRLLLPEANNAETLDRHALVVRQALGRKDISIHFSTGTPGPHRKTTGQISDSNEIIAYVKIAASPEVEKLLDSENSALKHFNAVAPSTIAIPHVVNYTTQAGNTYLFLSSPTHSGYQRTSEIDSLDVEFLDWIAQQNTTTLTLAQLLNLGIQQASIATVVEPPAEKIIRDAADSVATIIGSESIPAGPCHGDYAPWNTLMLPGNKLYVFDWEYSCQAAPPLFDLLYRIYMPGRLLNGLSAQVMVKRLTELFIEPRFESIINSSNVNKEHPLAYVILFFAWLCRRELLLETGVTDYLRNCLRYSLIKARYPGYSLKVLVSAYACEPDQGSEPGVGWNWAEQISMHHEAWIVTRNNNRDSIERELARKPNPNLHFVYVDPPRWLTFWKRKQRGIRAYYYLWQFTALKKTRALNKIEHFDIGHHVTFVSDWLWTFLSLLPIPYIWGPVGSNDRLPTDILASVENNAKEIIRLGIQTTVRWLDPLWWISALRASSIMTISANVAKKVPLRWVARDKLIVSSGIAIDHCTPHQAAPRSGHLVLFVGRHIPIKCGALLIDAFAQVLSKIPEARLLMIGEGPEEKTLRIKAHTLGIEANIEFRGWQPRDTVREVMASSAVFAFPSLEGGGMVVLEAMVAATPVVCLDFGGPGTMIDSSSGIKVLLSGKDETITRLSEAISTLLTDSAKREALGNGAARRAIAHFSWEAKGALSDKLYRAALDLHEVRGYTDLRGN